MINQKEMAGKMFLEDLIIKEISSVRTGKNTFIYLFPMFIEDDTTHRAFLKLRGKPTLLKIGFRCDSLDNKLQYNLGPGGLKNIAHPQDKEIFYLPLKLTNNTLTISYPSNKGPFKIYGIEGSKGLFPLSYFYDTTKGLEFFGLFHDKLLKRNSFKADDIFNKEAKKITDDLGGMLDVQINDKKNKQSEIEVISDDLDWREPKSIVKYLDRFIIGQEKAKKTLAVPISNYIVKALTDNSKIKKENLFLTGPTGVGKTYSIKCLAKKAGLPFITGSLTGKTAEGYKGSNLLSIFKDMRNQTKGEAPYGIIFLDEADKKTYKEDNRAFSEEIQNQLISWAESETIYFDDNSKKGENIRLNTKNILFIMAGAFNKGEKGKSLERIIKERLKGKKAIGFGSPLISEESSKLDEDILHNLTHKDVIEYGFKPEFVGRFPIIPVFNHLTTQDKIKILTNAEDSVLDSYKELFKEKGLKLDLCSETPTIIAEACPKETGARALETTCSQLFNPILFEPEKYKDKKTQIITITKELAKNILNPIKENLAETAL